MVRWCGNWKFNFRLTCFYEKRRKNFCSLTFINIPHFVIAPSAPVIHPRFSSPPALFTPSSSEQFSELPFLVKATRRWDLKVDYPQLPSYYKSPINEFKLKRRWRKKIRKKRRKKTNNGNGPIKKKKWCKIEARQSTCTSINLKIIFSYATIRWHCASGIEHEEKWASWINEPNETESISIG